MQNSWQDLTQINALMAGWIHRDLERWDALEALFHPGAEIEITWFRGTAAAFVAGSRRMADSPLRSRHLIGTPQIWREGERAVVETPAIIVLQHRGLRLGATTHSRFIDRVALQAGRWGIVRRQSSYDLSSLDFPAGPVTVDSAKLEAHLPEYAPLAYLLEAAGFPVKGPFPTRFSKLEDQIRGDAMRWLTSGESS